MRMKLRLIDREVTSVDTREGRLTLWALFVPLFIEQLLMNLMGTVNTLVLGHYSDEAVAAVGFLKNLAPPFKKLFLPLIRPLLS